MKASAAFIVLIVIAVLLCSCGSNPQAASDDANFSREQAIEKIKAISPGADVSSLPDLDKVVDKVRYYFVKASFPSKMTAEYFVDAERGKLFVAVAGELDTSNPLPEDSISPVVKEEGTVAEITAAKTGAVEDFIEALGMTAQQVEQKFGSDYSKVPVNYDSYMRGFLYRERGFTAAFGDDGKVARIYCSDKVDIGGARSGMTFSQIQEKLGKTVFRQTWVETPMNAAYEIEYAFGGRTVVFFSRQSEGSNSVMSIR